MPKKKTVILTYYDFPCTEPVLVNVFAKALGRTKNIFLLFHGDVSKGKKVKWHNSYVFLCRKIKGGNLFAKLLNKFFSLGKIINLLTLIHNDKANIVLVRDLPFEALWVSFLKKFYDFKLYFQYSAPLGDLDIEYSKSIRSIKRIYYYFRGTCYNLLINKALKKSDIVFPISDYHKAELQKVIKSKDMVPLTMGVDTDWLNRKKEIIPDMEYLKQDNFIIVYFGTLNFGRNPQFLLQLFEKVKRKYKKCKLILIGETYSQEEDIELKKICHDLKIQNDVIFTGQISSNSLRSYLHYCDISLSAIPQGNHFKISSPTKLYESMGCGVPVIANKGIDEQEKVIMESGGGVLVDYDTDSFSSAILNIIHDQPLREKMRDQGKEYILEHYDYQKIAENINDYF